MRFITLLLSVGLSLATHAQEIQELRQLQGDLLASHEVVRAIHQRDPRDASSICVESYRCANSNARVACVVGRVDAPIEQVWEIITDYGDYGQLIPRCTRSVVVSPGIVSAVGESRGIPSSLKVTDYELENTSPAATRLLYSEIDIIFPIGRVRSVLEITSDSTGNAVYWRKIASDVDVYEGAWFLIPSGEQTMVVCATRYRLNAWLPPFLIHSGVRYYFPQIIATLRNRVRQKP